MLSPNGRSYLVISDLYMHDTRYDGIYTFHSINKFL